MATEFINRLDDLLRQELLLLGYDYREVIDRIETSPGSEGVVVRFHPPYEDVEFDEPDPDVSSDAFAARVSRKLKVAIGAPSRTPPPEEDDAE